MNGLRGGPPSPVIGASPSFGAFTWVITATTPGAASAAVASIPRMRPAPIRDCSSTAWTCPGSDTSLGYRAAPVAFGTPSMRSNGWPSRRSFTVAVMTSPP